MFPLFSSEIHPDDGLRSFSTLDPLNQAQQHVVIRLVGLAGSDILGGSLSEPPCAGSTPTVPHTGDQEESVKVIQRTPCCWIAMLVTSE